MARNNAKNTLAIHHMRKRTLLAWTIIATTLLMAPPAIAADNGYFGYVLPRGNTFAVRVEACGDGTLVNSNGGVSCSGIKGDAVTQGELTFGLSARF